MTNMKDIRSKSDQELVELVQNSREALRAENLKDKFSKRSGEIHSSKKEIARGLTELHARRNSSAN
jgi:ribosomal protein L29